MIKGFRYLLFGLLALTLTYLTGCSSTGDSNSALGHKTTSDKVFPGVKIFIKNESLVVRSEFRGVTFCLEGKEVRVTKYEPIDQALARKLVHASVAH